MSPDLYPGLYFFLSLNFLHLSYRTFHEIVEHKSKNCSIKKRSDDTKKIR